MKRFVTTFAVILLLSLTSLSVATHSAYAATSPKGHFSPAKPLIVTVDCTNSQFLEIDSTAQGPTCFAQDGYIGFRIDQATTIHAGNNDGWVKCYGAACGAGKFFYFYAYYTYNLGGALITQVYIDHQG